MGQPQLKITIYLIILFATVLISREALALFCRPNLIPNGTALDGMGCVNCHINPFGSGDLNDFGLLVKDNASGCSAFWGETLALLDSDGDGFTNGQELQDPLGVWSEGQPAPGEPGLVTNPGLSGSFPNTPTPTETPVATMTPTATITVSPTPTQQIWPVQGITFWTLDGMGIINVQRLGD